MAFKVAQILYILGLVSPKPVGVRDEFLLKNIGSRKDSITQASLIMQRKPLQDYNTAVAFVMCQLVDEKAPKPEVIVEKYKRWISLVNNEL